MRTVILILALMAAMVTVWQILPLDNPEDAFVMATTNVWQILPLDNQEDACVATTNVFKMFTNDIPEDAFVMATTNVFQMFTAEIITHWKCPEHGVQWSALSIDDEPYCVECVYGQLIKLLKLEPMEEAE